MFMRPEQARPSLTLTERLRAETRAVHERLEGLPYQEALAAGTLPLESYVGHLRALSIIHGALEDVLAGTHYPALLAVWRDEMRKLPLLHRDLEHLTPHVTADVPAAVEVALRMAERVHDRHAVDPVSLLGYLYVLEGSTQGGRLVRKLVARAFSLSGDEGMEYLSGYGRETRAMWQAFKRRLDAAPLESSEQDRVVAVAKEAFAAFAELFQRLLPDRKDPR